MKRLISITILSLSVSSCSSMITNPDYIKGMALEFGYSDAKKAGFSENDLKRFKEIQENISKVYIEAYNKPSSDKESQYSMKARILSLKNQKFTLIKKYTKNQNRINVLNTMINETANFSKKNYTDSKKEKERSIRVAKLKKEKIERERKRKIALRRKQNEERKWKEIESKASGKAKKILKPIPTGTIYDLSTVGGGLAALAGLAYHGASMAGSAMINYEKQRRSGVYERCKSDEIKKIDLHLGKNCSLVIDNERIMSLYGKNKEVTNKVDSMCRRLRTPLEDRLHSYCLEKSKN